MANVYFTLRKPMGYGKTKNPKGKKQKSTESTIEQPIYLAYRFNQNDKLMYPIGFSIHPKYWNFEKGRIRDVTEVIGKDRINSWLNELHKATEDHIVTLKTQSKQLNKETLRKFLDDYIKPSSLDDSKLFGFIQAFIDQSESKVNPRTGQIIAYKTKRKYHNCFDLLKKFAAKKKRQEFNFEDINLDFYEDFIQYQQTLKLATNTIGRNIQTIKAFLNEATDRGLNKNFYYKSHRFKSITEDSETTYLNEKELEQLFNYDFSENKRLEHVRDLFLIGAYTGLRFSDFTRLSKDSIKDGVIHIKQQKTNAKVLIPCHTVFNTIWNKYKGELPKVISNQKFNEYIKEACKEAKIKDSVFKSITKGGVKITKKYEKHQLISSHTARRSFATNLYKSGFPALSIMQITGHKTEKAFLKYIKVTPDEHAKLLALHWQKNGNFLMKTS